ncbi:RES domain protein [Clavibacter michiganensis]|uniref:RES domain protein n=1 Tax=Clavibacter michiganensis TaxID=28447 RepID=A0A251Y887_9MICO|nr:RES domain protein [Clavibacter michiganensis]
MERPRPALRTDPGEVWRVGRAPDPWGWTDWRYAERGRFPGRWDSPDGSYRTIYAGSTPHACLVELLAPFCPDPSVADGLAAIVEDEADAALHPTVAPGRLDDSWFGARRLGRAVLTGTYCDITHSSTVAALRPRVLDQARQGGLADLDVASLQDARPRQLTHAIGRALYEETADGRAVVDGIRFPSRHGRDLELWAVFERASDVGRSGRLTEATVQPLDARHPAVRSAAALHGVRIG